MTIGLLDDIKFNCPIYWGLILQIHPISQVQTTPQIELSKSVKCWDNLYLAYI